MHTNTLDSMPALSRFKRRVNLNAQDPRNIAPNGDRYLVELLEIEENVTVMGNDGPIKIIIAQEHAPTKRPDGKVDPGVEAELLRGWRAGLILRVGNGHRLEVSDPYVVMPGVSTDKELEDYKTGKVPPPRGAQVITESHTLFQPQAKVQMFYAPGDVVLIERLTGREVTLQGKRYAIVNQQDVLAVFQNTKLSDITVEDE
jgi:co-chaperonin GroES (HSP10)